MNDVELERHIIGVLMMYPKSILGIIRNLKPEVFTDKVCNLCIKAMLKLNNDGVEWDMVTVGIELTRMAGDLSVKDIMDFTETVNTPFINEKYLFLLELYIAREHVRIANKAIQLASDPTNDILETHDIIKKELDALEGIITKDSNSTLEEVIARTYSDMSDRMEGKINPYWKTGNKKLDDILQISPKNILLIGGKSGSSKTKFIINTIYKLFKNNQNISCQWYTMEDPADKLIRAFIAIETRLTDSILQSKKRMLTSDEMELILGIRDKFMNWDIEYIEKPSSVKSVRANFKSFCARRSDNLNLLIIDNLMILEENGQRKNQTEIDDEIARGFQKIMNETNGYIILVHHLTDAQLDKLNFSSGYRPRESHLKGSTRYRDVATQIMLINRPSQYPDIVDYYRQREYINHLLLTDITKNRNNNLGLVRWFASPETNNFYEL